jgi:8-amino-7-oxononanoate synthase
VQNPSDSYQLSAGLARRRVEHLYRRRVVVDSSQGPRLRAGGREWLSFCSNDYLGLAAEPQLAAALAQAAREHGVGSGASHLVCGHHRAHHALEEELAEFVGAERALLFSTGYMANLGVVSALIGRKDLVLEDRLNHASLLDAGLLSRAELRRYAHGDAAAAEKLLGATTAPRALLCTDAVFSMDGDLAPIPQLAQLAGSRAARLLVDDAHGIGVLGRQGRGSLDHHGLACTAPVILMGTLGKAFGSFGAFVAGEADLVETLIQQARTYIYTTALPPALAQATRTGLALVRAADDRRQKLQALVERFRRGAAELGLPLAASTTPIQPLLLGDSRRALEVAAQLEQRGIWITAIRPPTVPAGSARLRITFSAAHDERDVDRLLSALGEVLA